MPDWLSPIFPSLSSSPTSIWPLACFRLGFQQHEVWQAFQPESKWKSLHHAISCPPSRLFLIQERITSRFWFEDADWLMIIRLIGHGCWGNVHIVSAWTVCLIEYHSKCGYDGCHADLCQPVEFIKAKCLSRHACFFDRVRGFDFAWRTASFIFHHRKWLYATRKAPSYGTFVLKFRRQQRHSGACSSISPFSVFLEAMILSRSAAIRDMVASDLFTR